MKCLKYPHHCFGQSVTWDTILIDLHCPINSVVDTCCYNLKHQLSSDLLWSWSFDEEAHKNYRVHIVAMVTIVIKRNVEKYGS